MPINQVAKELGVCATILKKICRRNRIPRWPHRKLKSPEKMVANLEANLSKNPAEADDVRIEIEVLRAKRKEILRQPDLLGKPDFQVGLQRGQSLLAARDYFEQQHLMRRRQGQDNRRRPGLQEPVPIRLRARSVLEPPEPEPEARHSSDSSDYEPERRSPIDVDVNYCELILSPKHPNLRMPIIIPKPIHAIELPSPSSDPGQRPTPYRPTTFTAPNILDFSQQLAAYRYPPTKPGSLSCAEWLPAMEPLLQSPIPLDFQAIPFGLQLSL
eukprot:TRINITY_DN13184_c0_g1_i1.p1 TRINITY_DN13184_c0_g1~~TRINITY_DN13184_c0_g1_i1.p1  ORF type:complete len:314 (+),score=80.98 TRINITY_DN13184_c0_g1_i1:131-943(+)